MAARHRRTTTRSIPYQVEETLSAMPRALPSAPDKRLRLLESKLRSRDPVRMAEVLRDLAYRQRLGRATGQDMRLLGRADRELTGWLAVRAGQERRWARKRMWGTVERRVSLLV